MKNLLRHFIKQLEDKIYILCLLCYFNFENTTLHLNLIKTSQNMQVLLFDNKKKKLPNFFYQFHIIKPQHMNY